MRLACTRLSLRTGERTVRAADCVAMLILIGRPPNFHQCLEAAARFGDPMLALQFARDVQDVDWILGDAPSPDREVMRVKQYVDFGFIACYAGLFLALSVLLVDSQRRLASHCDHRRRHLRARGRRVRRAGESRDPSHRRCDARRHYAAMIDAIRRHDSQVGPGIHCAGLLSTYFLRVIGSRNGRRNRRCGSAVGLISLESALVRVLRVLSAVSLLNPKISMNPFSRSHFKFPSTSASRATSSRPSTNCWPTRNQRVEAAVADPNPLHALDMMTERLDYAMSVVRHLESVATTPALRAAFNAVQPKVSAFYSSIPLNEGLWKAIQRYAAHRRRRARSPGPMHRFLTKTIDSFKRHGAELDRGGQSPAQGNRRGAGRGHHQILRKRSRFDQRLGDGDHRRSAARRACRQRRSPLARAAAESKGVEGWRFTLAGSQLHGGDDVSGRRDDPRTGLARLQHRARLPATHDNRAADRPRFWNCARKKPSCSASAISPTWCWTIAWRTPASARRTSSTTCARRPRSASAKRIRSWKRSPAAKLRALGHRLLGREAARRACTISTKKLCARTFRWIAWSSGMFEIFGRILGIRVTEETRHAGLGPGGEDATRFTIAATNAHLGSFYADWYPRENKRGGAWMDSLITGDPRARASRTWD